MRTVHLLTVSQHALLGWWGVPARGGACMGEVYLPSGVVPAQWGCTCPEGVYLPGSVPAQVLHPLPLWTEWQTRVKP